MQDRDIEECRSLGEYDRERERHENATLKFHEYAHSDPPSTVAHRRRMNALKPGQATMVDEKGRTLGLYRHLDGRGTCVWAYNLLDAIDQLKRNGYTVEFSPIEVIPLRRKGCKT